MQRALPVVLLLGQLALAARTEASEASRTVGRWELSSRFWVSLHQTLLEAAQRGSVDNPGEGEAERAAWEAAVSTYRERFGKRSPVFDRDLIAINDGLARVEDDARPAGLRGGLESVLAGPAAVYRQRRWPADDRGNRFWIAYAAAMLGTSGRSWRARTSRPTARPTPRR